MKDKLSLNPWTSIWLKPRETIREIINFNPKHLFFLLAWMYGIPTVLQFFQNYSFGAQFPLLWLSAAALIVAPLAGFLGIILLSALLFWTGKWMGGKACFTDLKAAVAWSNVPSVVNIGIWIVLMISFKERLFSATFSEGVFVGYELALVFFTLLFQVILAVWGFVIWVRMVSEVQQLSIWKALLNIGCACLILTAAWMVITACSIYIN